ncbi:glycosyltransferase family protein [Calidifontibacillus erzurumensis]|uniref:Glycosyltransferase involved in cell wall biosynthesis n=1 Tax=Calidifontibacillus erzurumensis TaxID=2741433 RepID=A0A8J8GGN4_9BACI|nr:hypothetical protein [Calidifontibacillus erzurumensis]NSL52038.1 hypothetical protein [Calidifontibacillus erzurumensis]
MKIAYFSPIYWDDLKQRPQHLAEQLSKKFEVYYIEPSLSFLSNKGKWKKKLDSNKMLGNLKIVTPSGMFRLPKVIELFDFTGINSLHEKIKLYKYLTECDMIWLGSPMYFPIIKNIKSKIIIYDKMDEYQSLTKNPLMKLLLIKYEKQLINRSDLIFISSCSFYSEISIKNKEVFVVNNAVDLNTLYVEIENEITKKIDNLKKKGYTVFGYIGTIDHWFDYEAIYKILELNKNIKIVLVGRNNIKKSNNQNILYYDPIRKEEVFSVIRKFDVCLYTFKLNDLINTINPVKVYEYLSCNKPTIAVNSIETRRFSKYLYLYNSYHELINIVKNVTLEKPFKTESELYGFIKENCWNSRAEYIQSKIMDKYIKDTLDNT